MQQKQQNNNKPYIELIEDLKEIVLSRRSMENSQEFIKIINSLDTLYNTKISIQFLINLIKDNNAKTNKNAVDKARIKINRILKDAKIKTTENIHFYSDFYLSKYKVFICDYSDKDFFGNLQKTRYQTIGKEVKQIKKKVFDTITL